MLGQQEEKLQWIQIFAAKCELRKSESSKKVEILQKEDGIVEERSKLMPSYCCRWIVEVRHNTKITDWSATVLH